MSLMPPFRPPHAPFVLVHGAWADGSSWAKVIPLLATRGHSVTAVQLPLTSLGDDVATVKRAIALASGPIILAGHSYGETNDRAIQPALQRSMAKRLNATVVEVAASHVAMLSHPQEVASLIAG